MLITVSLVHALPLLTLSRLTVHICDKSLLVRPLVGVWLSLWSFIVFKDTICIVWKNKFAFLHSCFRGIYCILASKQINRDVWKVSPLKLTLSAVEIFKCLWNEFQPSIGPSLLVEHEFFVVWICETPGGKRKATVILIWPVKRVQGIRSWSSSWLLHWLRLPKFWVDHACI